MTTNLQDYKNKRKLKIISKDINDILLLLNMFKKTLKPYSKYVPVRDLYLNIMNNESTLRELLVKYTK